MKNIKLSFVLVTAIMFAFTACEKEPGEGGTSTITGRVQVQDYDYGLVNGNWMWVKDGEYFAPDERVYIIYGEEDTIHSDDMRTNPEGYYRFQWLRKGNYTIFAYSDDTTGNVVSGVLPVEIKVEIKEKKEQVIAPDIVILN